MNTIQSITSSIDQIDLSVIRSCLAEHEGIKDSQARKLEEEYKRFIALAIAYPEHNLAISSVVDAFWHQHLMHTIDYVQFCERLAGRFLHHCPFEAHQADVEDEAIDESYLQTLSLYATHFGEPQADYWPARAGATQCYVPRDKVYFP